MLLAHARLAAVAALLLGCSSDGRSYWEGWPRTAPPSCDGGASACGRACVDLLADPRNCGACGRACAANERCAAGACACPAGSARCGTSTACVSLLGDRAHCGACNNACGTSAICSQGVCRCSGDAVLCAGRCVTVLADVARCGACDRQCPSGSSCVWGTCQPTCPAGRATCDASATTPCLTSLQTSVAHCGACGHPCAAGRTCVAGRCTCPSPDRCPEPIHPTTPTVTCDAAAQCPQVANAERACSDAGTCGYRCTFPRGRCPDATTPGCPNLLNAADRCGACDVTCARGEFCAWGVCACPPGQARCGGRCVDPRSDRAHCGGCEVGCGPEADCAVGRCAPREAARLVAPPSGAVVATARPTFRWLAGRGDGPWRVTLCRDRACAQPVATLDAFGTSATPTSDLGSAVYFWRVTRRRADGSDGATSPTWALRVGARRDVGGGLIGHFIDVNGDGYADHVRVDGITSRVCVLAGSPTGLRVGACPAREGPSGVALRFTGQVAPGDFNGDGFTDVAALGANQPQVRVFILWGGPTGLTLSGSFGEGEAGWQTSGTERALHGVGDYDEDGYADLALTITAGTVPVVTLHAGGPAAPTWQPRRVLSAPDGVMYPHGGGVANVGDLNGDGRADLVVVSRALSGLVRVLTYQPTAEGLPAAPTWSTVSDTRALSAAEGGDFDGDGAADVLVKNDRSLWFVRGGGPLGSPQLVTHVLAASQSPLATTFAGAHDLDGDGRSDFVAVSAATAPRTLRMYRGAPAGLSLSPSREAPIDPTTSTPAAVWLGDVNRDGFDDVGVTLTTEILVYHGGADGLPDHPTQRVVLRGPDP